jgi:hypothetical protein
MNRIISEAELDALYGDPVPTSILKEVDHITDDCRKLIEASHFAILATSGPEGLDCSPRGDPRGFVLKNLDDPGPARKQLDWFTAQHCPRSARGPAVPDSWYWNHNES